jgi:hypothetical protein
VSGQFHAPVEHKMWVSIFPATIFRYSFRSDKYLVSNARDGHRNACIPLLVLFVTFLRFKSKLEQLPSVKFQVYPFDSYQVSGCVMCIDRIDGTAK